MKKQHIICTSLGLMLVLFVSCRKEYTCTCYVDNVKQYEYNYEEEKKRFAEDLCKDQEAAFQIEESKARCELELRD